ncbi:MAG: YncE family protein [Polyangiales bacterium]
MKRRATTSGYWTLYALCIVCACGESSPRPQSAMEASPNQPPAEEPSHHAPSNSEAMAQNQESAAATPSSPTALSQEWSASKGCFGPEDRWLVGVHRTHYVVRNTEGGRVIARGELDGDISACVVGSATDGLEATFATSRGVSVVDLTSGSVLHQWPDESILIVDTSDDGRRILVVSATPFLVDLDAPQPRVLARRHGYDLSADGRRVVSYSYDDKSSAEVSMIDEEATFQVSPPPGEAPRWYAFFGENIVVVYRRKIRILGPDGSMRGEWQSDATLTSTAERGEMFLVTMRGDAASSQRVVALNTRATVVGDIQVPTNIGLALGHRHVAGFPSRERALIHNIQ